MQCLLFCLPIISIAFARPIPQFAGIGPWEGEFFGADPGQEYRYALTPYAAPMIGGVLGGPGVGYPYANPYAADPYTANPYGNYDPYSGQIHPDGVPVEFIEEPEAPPPPPPEPVDLMTAPKERLPKPAPPPPPPKPVESAEAKDPAEGPEGPRPQEEDEDLDFMGGRWGIAGQGKYIDAARGDHKLPAGVEREREDRRGKYRRLGLDSWDDERKGSKKKETEEMEQEEPKAVQNKPEEMQLPEVKVEQDPNHPLRYNVHIGEIKTGADDPAGPSNFHVFTDESTKEMSSNDMNPETERYIKEKMIPKLGGRRKKGGNGGGNIFGVFGGGN